MWNVIRAQIYQLLRDKLAWGGFLISMVMSVVLSIFYADEYTSGSEYVAGMGMMTCMMGMIAVLIIVASVTGVDFTDKTLNYEILSGHTRAQVFFGRWIVAELAGIFACMTVMLAPVIVITFTKGWGDAMDLEGVVLRYSLVIVTLVSIVSQLVFVTIVTKNMYVTFLVGFVFGYAQAMLGMVVEMIPELTPVVESPMLSVNHCCTNLLNFEEWTTFFLNEKDQIVYNSAVSSELVIMTIATAVIGTIILVLLSYTYFKNDDLS